MKLIKSTQKGSQGVNGDFCGLLGERNGVGHRRRGKIKEVLQLESKLINGDSMYKNGCYVY